MHHSLLKKFLAADTRTYYFGVQGTILKYLSLLNHFRSYIPEIYLQLEKMAKACHWKVQTFVEPVLELKPPFFARLQHRSQLKDFLKSVFCIKSAENRLYTARNTDNQSSLSPQSLGLSVSPMESESLGATTDPKDEEIDEESEERSTAFEDNQPRYQTLISTLPHVKGWRLNDPLFEYGGHWWLQPLLEGCIHAQEFFKGRPSDFFVCSYPKTGTTWLKALTFAIVNRSRFDDSSNPLLKRNPHEFVPYVEIDFPFFPQVDVLKDKGNTLFSTHIPHESLPDSILNSGCKMVYIWRDPKDTFVSMWTFVHKERSELGPVNSLEESFDMFCQGLSAYGPYLDHVLGYWKAYQKNPDRILFLKYEPMRANPLPYVKKLAEFMGYGFSTEEEKGIVEKVVNLCSFETLKNLEANTGEKDREDRPAVYANSAYFRKAKVGDWENYLTPEMAARIDGLMENKFKGTGLLEHCI